MSGSETTTRMPLSDTSMVALRIFRPSPRVPFRHSMRMDSRTSTRRDARRLVAEDVVFVASLMALLAMQYNSRLTKDSSQAGVKQNLRVIHCDFCAQSC